MWTGDKLFYDLVGTALGNKRNLQPFIDSTKDAYNKLETDGFPFAANMQADFTFEQLSKEYGINAMATWVDIDSPGTPISADGEHLQTGKIPRNKKYASFDENEYRQLMIKRVTGVGLDVLAQDALFNANKKLIDAHTNALTYMRHQMVSKGQFELTEKNNYGGIKGDIYSASIPAKNKVKSAWFTVDKEGVVTPVADADPVKDLREVGNKVQGVAFHWEVDAVTLKNTLNHPNVLLAVGYAKYPLASPENAANAGVYSSDADRKSVLEDLIGFPIKAIDSISRVDTFERGKGVVGVEVRSFEPNNWALVPDGRLGEILVVAPIAVGEESAFASYYGGRLLLTYDYDVRKKTQYIESEMTALVVPDKPKYMHILTVV